MHEGGSNMLVLGTLLHVRNTTRFPIVARILSAEQAGRLFDEPRDTTVIAPELTVEAGATLHVPLNLSHLTHFDFRPILPTSGGGDSQRGGGGNQRGGGGNQRGGSRDDTQLSWCEPISVDEVMRGETRMRKSMHIECEPREKSDVSPWEKMSGSEAGRDPWCCTISLDLEPIGGADGVDEYGGRTTRQHQARAI